MREIRIPPDLEPHRPDFAIVKIRIGTHWTPAVLHAWYRTPDGWACTIEHPSHLAARGRVTHRATYLYDPADIQPITPTELNP